MFGKGDGFRSQKGSRVLIHGLDNSPVSSCPQSNIIYCVCLLAHHAERISQHAIRKSGIEVDNISVLIVRGKPFVDFMIGI
jgi:hypothetical protein